MANNKHTTEQLKKALKKAYKITGKGENLTLKSEYEFAYRIKRNKKNELVLEQQYQERNYEPLKWYGKKKSENINDLLIYIMTKYNKFQKELAPEWPRIIL